MQLFIFLRIFINIIIKDIYYYNYSYTEPNVSIDATDHALMYSSATTKQRSSI